MFLGDRDSHAVDDDVGHVAVLATDRGVFRENLLC